jgi:hypothetical protein
MAEEKYQYGPQELTREQAELVQGLVEDAVNRQDLEHSVAAKPHDPAFWMLLDDCRSTPVVHREGCYICEDPEFALMGLPLCRPCPECIRQGRGQGHIPADDDECSECGYQDGPQDYGQEE